MPEATGGRRPRVLLITGAYYPEISAAAVQCRAVAAALRGRADLSVLTTAHDSSLPGADRVDDVPVHRVAVDVRSRASRWSAGIRFVRLALAAGRGCDVIHVHGVSQKNVLAWIVARTLGKSLVLTLHTAGQDEPSVVRRAGALAFRAFTSADLVMAVSPALAGKWRAAGLQPIRVTPNGVDMERFRPASEQERQALRRDLGWPAARPVVLFVGFFSRDKRPDLLFRAWRRLVDGLADDQGPVGSPVLAFAGAKATAYYEIDATLFDEIRREAAAIGRSDAILPVEPTHEIDRCYRAADLFVLPSIREAHPLALLEAMACGLPCIATNLPGATDVLIEDGVNGRLVPPDDEPALARTLDDLLRDPAGAAAMGARARETVVARYDIRRTADAWLDAYAAVIDQRDQRDQRNQRET